MKFAPPLTAARLIRRYKRFLADVEASDGCVLTLHCPNTGSMRGCAEPGWRVWYSRSDNPKRKYPHTWELVENASGCRIGVNTGRANALVSEALAAGRIPELARFGPARAEVPMEGSRMDFVLGGSEGSEDAGCVVEVKSVTLGVADGWGLFPDAPSDRARRHLQLLATRARAGDPAALVYCVQHDGIERVAPADDIDPAYGRALRDAIEAGVRVMAWGGRLDPHGIELVRPLEVIADGRGRL